MSSLLKKDPYYAAIFKQALGIMEANQREHAVHLLAGCEAVLERRELGLSVAARTIMPEDVQAKTSPVSHIESIRITFSDVQQLLYNSAKFFEVDCELIGPR